MRAELEKAIMDLIGDASMKKLATKHRAKPNQKLPRDRRPRRPVRQVQPMTPQPLPVRGKTVHLAGPGHFVTDCGLWIERRVHRLPTSGDELEVTCSNCRPSLKASGRRIG